jgi:hypothetical protein
MLVTQISTEFYCQQHWCAANEIEAITLKCSLVYQLQIILAKKSIYVNGMFNTLPMKKKQNGL